MTVDTAEVVNGAADWALKSDTMNRLAANPLYTALLCAIVVMLIIAYVFRDATTDDGLITTTIRAGFWTAMFTTVIVFLHDRVLFREQDDARAAAVSTHIFDTDRSLGVDSVLVQPEGVVEVDD